jgi:hypothetical protein
MITGGHMKAPITTPQSPAERPPVKQVSRNRFTIGAGKAAPVTVGPKEHPNLVSLFDQGVDKVGSNKPRGAGDEASHVTVY